MDDLSQARDSLRQRQGAGASYDAGAAPHQELLLARLGTAYFARKLEELDDDELYAPSNLPGWSRAELAAHVGYNARAIARLAEWARTGVENRMYESAEHRNGEILLGGTLPAHAIRNLCRHAAVQLDVLWRDLDDEMWDRHVVTFAGREIPARDTPWMRAKEVWIHAVDLGNGGRFRDFPKHMLDDVMVDVINTWNKRGESVNLTLRFPDGTEHNLGKGGPVITGAEHETVQWLTGRGQHGLTSSAGALPTIPRWF